MAHGEQVGPRGDATLWCDEHGRYVAARDPAHAMCVRHVLRPVASVAPTRSAVTGAGRVVEPPRIVSGLSAWDLVTGGGMVPGSAIGISGEPGAGKSTLLAELAGHLHRCGVRTLYATAEERTAAVDARARRTGATGFRVAEVRSWEELAAELAALKARGEGPRVVVIDSVQALRVEALKNTRGDVLAAGHPTVVQQLTGRAVALAATGLVVIVVFQLTKEGLAAGPRTTHHAVDVMLRLRRETRGRILEAEKNRHGACMEVALRMGPHGLVEADAARPPRSAGQVWASILRGGAAQLARVDAAVSEGRRGVEAEGLDRKRVARIVEALSGSYPALAKARVTVTADEGVDTDPAADLACAAAIVGALRRVEAPLVAWAGRVSVTGDVEPAEELGARLARCARAGLRLVTGEAPGLDPRVGSLGRVAEIGEALSGAEAGARAPSTAPVAAVPDTAQIDSPVP